MPKPTVLQSLLGRPSRTYTELPVDHPPNAQQEHHNYYSAKPALIRAASIASAKDLDSVLVRRGSETPRRPARPAQPAQVGIARDDGIESADSSPRPSRSYLTDSPGGSPKARRSKPEATYELVHFPGATRASSSSPLVRSASQSSRTTAESSSTHVSYTVTITPPSPVIDKSSQTSRPRHAATTPSPPQIASKPSDSDSEEDETFYTPLTTPATSPRSSVAFPGGQSDPPAATTFSAFAADVPVEPSPPPSVRSPSPSDEGASIFSSSSSVPSTHVTTPMTSDAEKQTYFSTVPNSTYLRVPGIGPRRVAAHGRSSSLDSASTPSASSSQASLERQTRRRSPAAGSSSQTGLSRTGSSRSGSSRAGSSHSRTSRPPLKKRMSAVYEESDEEAEGTGAPRPRRPSKRGGRARSSSSASTTVTALPTPMPAPSAEGSGSGSGYTSLVLPRAAYRQRSDREVARALASGSVDLGHDALAQATMATVEVVAGVARAQSLSERLSPFRRRAPARPRVQSEGDATDDAATARALGLASHVAPPAAVPAHCVLVRVHAVGLDGTDARLVAAHARTPGFVPGRAVLGRAAALGADVPEDRLRRGDWLVGLLDVRRCGALAEFVLVPARRCARAPRPRPARGGPADGPSAEELALLPAVGVPAFRAVRSFPWPALSPQDPPPRALVLHAHDGAGAFALRLMVERGAAVYAQVPHAGAALDVRLRAWGATDVRGGTPLAVLDALRAEGATFDFVLDAAGGRAVWERARPLLAQGALFATLLGDAPDTPVPSGAAHWRAGMRALGRAGAYAWVSVGADADLQGEDVRAALDALLAPGARAVMPHVPAEPDERARRVLPFERAPDAFGPACADGLRGGGTAVVKLVE